MTMLESAGPSGRLSQSASADRPGGLQQLAAVLAPARTPAEVCSALARSGVQLLGARAGGVALLSPDGAVLTLVASEGYSTGLVDRFARIPVTSSLPLAEAVRTGSPIYLSSLREIDERYPELAAAAAGLPRSRALACLPLAAEGRALGALWLGFEQERAFDAADRTLAAAAAICGAEALARAHLREEFERLLGEQQDLAAGRDRSLALLDSVLDNIPVGLAFVDAELRCLRLNQALEDMYGLAHESHVGRTLEELVPTLAADMACCAREVFTSGRAVLDREITGELPSRPGEPRAWRESYFPVRARDGAPSWVGIMVQEVTEQRRADEATARLAALVQSSDDGIVGKLLDGTITSWNAAAERIFGYSAAEMIGNTIYTIVPGDRHDEERDILARLARGERIEHYETVRRRKDGRLIHIGLTVSPIRDRSGKVIGASSIKRDISDRKRLEEERARYAELLEHRVTERTAALLDSLQQLESFSYSVSHDLRAPLRAIQGFTDVLLEELGSGLNGQSREYARRITEATRRMDRLILDLLAFSRMGREKPPLEPVGAAATAAEVIAALGEMARERQATLELEPGPSELLVLAHRPTLSQVLTNLVENAMKFRAPGRPPRVSVRVEGRGDLVRLWVEDNGIGIAPEYHERIFRPFERLHGTREYPGSGVGLAIVHRGVVTMGGRVGVESTPGEGSRFWIELARAAPRLDGAGAPAARA